MVTLGYLAREALLLTAFLKEAHDVRSIWLCRYPKRCPRGCRPAVCPKRRRDCCRSMWDGGRKARSHRARFLPVCNSTKRGRAAPKPPKTTKPADTEFACVQRVGWRWWKRCNLLCYNEIGGGYFSLSISALCNMFRIRVYIFLQLQRYDLFLT